MGTDPRRAFVVSRPAPAGPATANPVHRDLFCRSATFAGFSNVWNFSKKKFQGSEVFISGIPIRMMKRSVALRVNPCYLWFLSALVLVLSDPAQRENGPRTRTRLEKLEDEDE